MDMKCKKLILLTMKKNNAIQTTLRFTSTKTVNLNMFFKVSAIIIIIGTNVAPNYFLVGSANTNFNHLY